MPRNSTLDVLRGAAILLVFCYHSEGMLLVGRFGWTGVDLFFVLSGFLVSGLLFREYQAVGNISPGRFLLRRGFKIYPQFYVLLAVGVVSLLAADRLYAGQLLTEAFFLQNYLRGFWAHTWSLAVEEHFYLLLTAVVAFLARRGGRDPFSRLPVGIAVACVTILCLRILTWRFLPGMRFEAYVFPSHLRMDSLLTGVLVAYLHTFRAAELARWMDRFRGMLPIASILLLSPVTFLMREDPFMVTFGFSLVALGFALLLLSVLYPVKPITKTGRVGRAMARLGQVSYGFYLWHVPVLQLADQWRANAAAKGSEIPLWAVILATFAASVLAAFLTTWLIETPCLRLRSRWVPGPPTTARPHVDDLTGAALQVQS